MKRFILVFVTLVLFCTGCGSNTTVVEDVDEKVIETVSATTSKVEKDYVSALVPVNADTVNDFVVILENVFSDIDFEIVEYSESYYDEYFEKDIDESAYIVGKNENNFEVLHISVCFVNSDIFDFSISTNVESDFSFEQYKDSLFNILSYVVVDYRLSESEIMNFVNSFFDFDKYTENVYGNQETNFEVNNVFGLGVIFDGGKDIQFDGVSYYFAMMQGQIVV